MTGPVQRMSLEAARTELRGVADRMRLVDGEAALPTVLGGLDRALEQNAKLTSALIQAGQRVDQRPAAHLAPADAVQPVPDTGQAREADDLTEALNWLRSNWATNPRDWADDRREAAWYGVLVGWDCEEDHDHDDFCAGTSAMDSVARRHVWAPAFVEALRRRRAAVAAVQSRDTVQAPAHPVGCPACSGMLTDRDCDGRRRGGEA